MLRSIWSRSFVSFSIFLRSRFSCENFLFSHHNCHAPPYLRRCFNARLWTLTLFFFSVPLWLIYGWNLPLSLYESYLLRPALFFSIWIALQKTRPKKALPLLWVWPLYYCLLSLNFSLISALIAYFFGTGLYLFLHAKAKRLRMHPVILSLCLLSFFSSSYPLHLQPWQTTMAAAWIALSFAGLFYMRMLAWKVALVAIITALPFLFYLPSQTVFLFLFSTIFLAAETITAPLKAPVQIIQGLVFALAGVFGSLPGIAYSLLLAHLLAPISYRLLPLTYAKKTAPHKIQAANFL